MLKKLRALYQRYRSVFWYLFTGGVTTLTNIAVFALLSGPLGMHYQTANGVAWAVAVAVAFGGNKYLAFESRAKGAGLWREAGSFLLMRLLTLGFEALFLFLTVEKGGWNALVAKIIDNLVVIVLNYVLSRLFVFRKK